MNLSCLVIDDEPLAGNLLEDYIGKVSYLHLEKKCLTALEGLAYLQDRKIDLIFLDINLPHLSGMEFARVLPPDQKVIFTTAYTSYAVESYAVNAIDYLLKPITFDRFMRAVEKTMSLAKLIENHATQTHSEKANFFVKSGKAMVKIHPDDIYFIEGLKDYVIFWLANEKHIVYKKMKELELILGPHFMRVHHSVIVNLDHVKKIEDNHIHILDRRISITAKYKDAFIAFIKNRLM